MYAEHVFAALQSRTTSTREEMGRAYALPCFSVNASDAFVGQNSYDMPVEYTGTRNLYS